MKKYRAWIPFLAVTTTYLLLIVPTIRYLGISWDEEIDLKIARAYLTTRGFFFGLPLDHTQTRLPMFLVALAYRMLGVNDLITARWISVIMGWLTLLAVYLYGKSRFSQAVGLLAAWLLAISPFFLSFARVAFTESDIYLACALSWFLLAASRMQERPTVGRAAIAGLFFGLSLATKATAIVILPAIWIAFLINPYITREKTTEHPIPDSFASGKAVLFWAGWAIFISLVGVYVGIKLDISSYRSLIRLIHYGMVCLGWGILFVWIYSFRNHLAGYVPLAFLVTGIGLLTFLILPPDHLTNSRIIQSLFTRADNEMSFSLAYAGELAALHTLAVVFKSTLFIGICLLSGCLVSLFQWRQVGVLALLILGGYFFGLLLLPLGQTFYTVPLLPILCLLTAFQFMQLWAQHRNIAYVLATICIVWWGMEMIQSYPDYHLNSYQWLGNRVLFGRSSVGYRSVVFTPADGVQQAVEWLNQNAESGKVVQLYVGPQHIVRYLAPKPIYVLSNGYQDTLLSNPDYVVVHINDTIWSGNGRENPVGNIIRYPYDPIILEQHYEKVFAVTRAFEIEMVSIWQRK